MNKTNEIDAIKDRIRATAADMGIQILPPREECERCGAKAYITNKIIGEFYELRVCVKCTVAAQRLENVGIEGTIKIEEI
jgi:hypothetical protein